MKQKVRLMPNAKIVQRPPFRVNYQQREIIRSHVAAMKQMGILEESSSPWSFPVVLAPKPGGKWRFAIDYRAQNTQVFKDSFPLIRTDDALQRFLGLCSYYRKFIQDYAQVAAPLHELLA